MVIGELEKSVTNYNKLIAYFLGATLKLDGKSEVMTVPSNTQGSKSLLNNEYKFPDFTPFSAYVVDLRYHKSWSWLMPVIEQIEKLDCSNLSYSWDDGDKIQYNFTYPKVEIDGLKCWIYFDLQLDPFMTISDIKSNSKIESCYKAVIEFINWYNKQINNNEK